jgi:CubicO group peptidase (beta-lactamase class C family)
MSDPQTWRRQFSAANGNLRTRLLIVGALSLAILLRGLVFLTDAGAIGAGYAAKQLCSGVFVARLPELFVLNTDVLPRLATAGPMAPLLDYEIDHERQNVSASMLGREMTAQFERGFGCTLSATEAFQRKAFSQRAVTLPPHSPDTPRGNSPGEPMPAATLASDASARLNAALDAAFAEPPEGDRRTLAVLVMHRGVLVAERYQAPVSVENPMQGWSMNKSLMATFIGYQIDTGKLNLNDSVWEMLRSEGFNTQDLDRIDRSLSLRHLLSMSSGFDFSERYFPGDDVTAMLYQHPVMGYSAPSKGHAHPPGEEFAYSSGDINTASLMWQQSLEGEAYPDWLAKNFIGPLGLQEMVMEPDARGVQVGSSYAYLTARDWARMGQLWLDAWHGRSAIISQAWQTQAVTPGTATNGEIYGLGFWLNTGQRRFPSAPESTFNAGGNSGQFVVVMPEEELVVVRLGLTLDESKANMNVLLADLLETVR